MGKPTKAQMESVIAYHENIIATKEHYSIFGDDIWARSQKVVDLVALTINCGKAPSPKLYENDEYPIAYECALWLAGQNDGFYVHNVKEK